MNIHLCIYNIHMSIFDYYKVDDIGPTLNPFDIVCLQGAYIGANRLVNNTNFKYRIHPNTKRHFYTLYDSGLLTLSNMNLHNYYFEVYNDCSGFQDSIVSKGLLMTRWKINNKYVDVYNTEMQEGCDEEGFNAAQAQVDQLVRAIKRLTPPENGLLIVGTFYMAPMRNKTHKELYTLYEDELTMMNRMNIFNSLVVRLHLLDVWDILKTDPTYDGFHRCLYRNGTNVTITPNTIQGTNPIIVNLTVL